MAGQPRHLAGATRFAAKIGDEYLLTDSRRRHEFRHLPVGEFFAVAALVQLGAARAEEVLVGQRGF